MIGGPEADSSERGALDRRGTPAPTAATSDPTALEADLVRRAEREADRLAVVGPRLAGRESASAATALDDIRQVTQNLADLGADAEGRARRPVPVLAAHALGDQVRVLAHDVAATRDTAALSEAVQLLRDLAARI